MTDKKNEDFVVRMPDSGNGFDAEKDVFLRKDSPQRGARRDGLVQQFYAKIDNSPPASIIAYCLSSISMTVVNKYVVSGTSWNLNFFYLAIQVRLLLASTRKPRLGAGLTCARPVDRMYSNDHDLQTTWHDYHTRSFRPDEGKEMYVLLLTASHYRRMIQALTRGRVPHLAPPCGHDLYQHQGSPVPLRTRLHHL